MPLQNLYNTSPLAEFDKLSLGAHLGMSPQMARTYLDRQAGYERLQDLYNTQSVEKYNPAEIRRMELANEQQAYMMPTYQEQGKAAQSKMDTPSYYTAARRADVTGYEAEAAENKNKQVASAAKAPYIQPTTVATAETNLDTAVTTKNTAETQKLYQMLTDPRITNITKEEAVKYVQERFPNQAQKVIPLILKYGVTPTATMFAKHLVQQTEIDPKYIHAAATAANKPLDPYALALEAARAKLGPSASQAAVTTEAFSMLALRQPGGQPTASTETHELVPNPDGTFSLRKKTTKTPGTAPAPAKEVIVPQGAKPLGKAPPGTPDGQRTINGKPVVVKDGIVYGK